MIEFRSLREDELEKWFDHCSKVFQDTPREYFVRHWNNDPWKNLSSIFVAVEDEEILSTVRVFHREIYITGEKIRIGGIGEVSTKAEARKRGLCCELLKRSIEYMENQDIKVSILFGNHPNYSKLGWRFIDISLCSSYARENKGLYKIRKTNFNNDIKALKDIYKSFSKNFNGVIVRDNELYWDNWIKDEEKNSYVAEDCNGNIVGYIAVERTEDTAAVIDFAGITELENIFEELAYYSCKELGVAYKIKYPAVINSTLSINNIEKIDHNMVKLISPFKIDNKIVGNTEELIKVLLGREDETNNSKFNFWFIDGF